MKKENKNLKRGKKLTVELIKMEVGQSVTGTYVGKSTRDWTDPQDGEVKPLTTAVFQHIGRDERFGVFQDAGLKLAMENALVSEGDAIEIVKLEKANMSGGRTVNQYDIFALEAE